MISSIIQSIRNGLPAIHPEGYPFIIIFFIISLVLGLIWNPFFWIGICLTAWCIYFFRDPQRMIPIDKNFVISPADGIISAINIVDTPDKLKLPYEKMIRISIFMDIFSCHVNRIPIDGTIESIKYYSGRFSNTAINNSSDNNEQNCLIINSIHGNIAVIQIAGLIARRIVCWSQPGDIVYAGKRFGLIRFGSRIDIYLPSDFKIQISVGQKMFAGETILAICDINVNEIHFRKD